jgi:hypothetical protein
VRVSCSTNADADARQWSFKKSGAAKAAIDPLLWDYGGLQESQMEDRRPAPSSFAHK